MKKFLKIVGVYFLTIIIIFIVKYLFIWLFFSMTGSSITDHVLYSADIYSLVGLIGVCTYILYTKK